MAVAHRDVAGLLKKHGYREMRKLGEGSFGKAILVRSMETDKELVCKMVDISKASSREQQDAVKEGKLLAQIKHPYVVRYRENFVESGWLCIVMDFCEGGDLSKKIQQAQKARQPIPEDQILRWLTQSILALKYIHDKHILHRDLKPGNLFISKNGTIKMGDFGIAKVLSSTVACARTQIGTPYYLSPEVCQEKPYAWASDIWAMGCILYEMCALKVPFDATSIPGLVQKICRGPIPSVPQAYSDFTRQLCAEMLNRNPHARPSTDDILQRPRIQAIVRQMLDEVEPACPRPEPMPPRAAADSPMPPRAAADSPMPQRSPSVGAVARVPSKQACPSPSRQRSPSVEALRRNTPTPCRNMNPPPVPSRAEQGAVPSRGPSPRRGVSPAPGSGCGTPSRSPSPQMVGAAPRPRKPASPSQIRPPCIPKQDRRNAALAAAGMGIVGT